VLAAKALKVWKPFIVDETAVKAAELKDLKSRAARYSVEKLGMEQKVRELFEDLRKRIQALGEDVVELCNEKSVTYRAGDYFVEIIPRKRKLTLLLNLDFEDCDDPSGDAIDAAETAFVINSIEDGSVLFLIRNSNDLDDGMHLIRQAYERVTT
jgi:predicted transport protein